MKFAMRVYIYFRQLIVYNQQSVSLNNSSETNKLTSVVILSTIFSLVH